MHYKFFILFLFFIFTKSYAINISEKQLEILSKDNIWLKLIHYKNKKSEIKSKDFYLSNKNSAKDELLNTLKAYENFSNYKKDNTHPQCKFPARYFWLSKKLNFSNYQEIKPFCKKLEKWKAINNNTSISTVLVSGYLGNPASTFGHSFIKINTENENNLFDLSINYGALVPDNEPIIKYILKGIFGGYEAGFSDKYFYTQDLVYSHNEFRDMWEYELNLNTYEKKIILYHIWEVIAKKFDYYFLDKNCAYRVSELLEIITQKPIIENARLWYAPIETFHKLEDLNSKKNFIKKIKYIPSSEKKVFKSFNILSDEEKSVSLKLIHNNYKGINKLLSNKSDFTKINILNFLLDYEKYARIKNNKRNKKYNRLLLIERFKLPISKKNKLDIKYKKSPAKGNKPSFISSSSNYLNGFGYYPSFDFSAFAIESIGDNNLHYDELIVGNTSIGLKRGNIFLNHFDLIKIKKLKKTNLPWEKSFTPSWNLNIGTRSIYQEKKINDIFLDAGIGKTYKLNNTLIYPFINASLHSNYPYLMFSPNINLNFEIYNIKNLISTGIKLNTYNSDINEFIKISSQYKVSQNSSLSINHQKDIYQKSSIQLKFYF